jgi:hypothetical protein
MFVMGEQHWVYYGVYMGFMLLTHHKHLSLLWCLYGVHVAHPSQTSGFIMVFIWGSCCSPITNIWVYYGVYMGFMLLTHHRTQMFVMGEQHEPHINTIINPDVCDG